MDTIQMDFQEQRKKAALPLLWVGIAGIVMIFAALTSGYVFRRGFGDWVHFELPSQFLYSTLCIVLSSIALFLAQRAVAKNNQKNLVRYLGLTLLLGFGFVWSQYMAWGQLVEMNIFFGGHLSSASGSFLYAITGIHIAHLFAGLVALVVTLFKAIKGRYNASDKLGIQLCATYWHFLGALWIYLLWFLMYIR